MASVKLEVEGKLAFIYLPEEIDLVRIFLKSKRIELITESKIQMKVADTSGVPRPKKSKNK